MSDLSSAVEQPVFLNRERAAKYLQQKYGSRTSKSTLEKMAVRGDGPIFRSLGRQPVYKPEDLDAWAQARISGPRKSTSDNQVAA